MFERDYLMNLIYTLIQAMLKSRERAQQQKDPKAAADLLEAAIGQATDIDGATLLSLTPESMVSIMQVAGVDQNVLPYIAHSLKQASEYYAEASDEELARLRREQAEALAECYGIDLSEDMSLEVEED